MTTGLRVDFCGEVREVTAASPFVIGRQGDLVVDDNPFLHRRFLVVSAVDGVFWLANVGSSLTATVADADGLMQAWLAPGGRLPVVFETTRVWFTAGPTTYELELFAAAAPFAPTLDEFPSEVGTTMGRTTFTPDQRLLVLALAEPLLRRGERGQGRIPSNADAAARLGWSLTKFNRKLDNVCQKLAKQGVRGLHGDASRLASTRRARLVEHVVAARLVTRDQLAVLDRLPTVGRGESSPSTTTPAVATLPRQGTVPSKETHAAPA